MSQSEIRSPRRGMCAAVLSLEAITLGLSTPVMITLTDVSTTVALALGLGLAVACLLLAGLLRSEWAYGAGWAIQLAAIGMGFLVPMMVVLGLVFLGLYTAAYVVGARIDQEKAEREVAAANAPPPA